MNIPMGTDGVYLFTDDLNTGLMQYVYNNQMSGVGGAVVATTLSAALLQNKLDGHPILAPDGLPIYDKTSITNVVCTPENAADFENYILVNEIFTKEVYQQFVWRYNNNVSYQDFIDFANVYDLDWIKSIH